MLPAKPMLGLMLVLPGIVFAQTWWQSCANWLGASSTPESQDSNRDASGAYSLRAHYRRSLGRVIPFHRGTFELIHQDRHVEDEYKVFRQVCHWEQMLYVVPVPASGSRAWEDLRLLIAPARLRAEHWTHPSLIGGRDPKVLAAGSLVLRSRYVLGSFEWVQSKIETLYVNTAETYRPSADTWEGVLLPVLKANYPRCIAEEGAQVWLADRGRLFQVPWR